MRRLRTETATANCFNFHLELNASFIRYAVVEVWRRMRRLTHAAIFEILIKGRNSFFNRSLPWRCRPDCLRFILSRLLKPQTITRLSKMAAQCDRSLKTGNECTETKHQRPDQNKHLSRVERSTCQSLEVLLLHPL